MTGPLYVERDGDRFWALDIGEVDGGEDPPWLERFSVGLSDGTFGFLSQVGYGETVDFESDDAAEFVRYLHTRAAVLVELGRPDLVDSWTAIADEIELLYMPDGLSDVTSEGIRWWLVGFGGAECEYCGYNVDQIEVSEHDGEFKYRLSTGCSGGDSFETRDAVEFVAKLRALRRWIEVFDEPTGDDDEPAAGTSEYDDVVNDVERRYIIGVG